MSDRHCCRQPYRLKWFLYFRRGAGGAVAAADGVLALEVAAALRHRNADGHTSRGTTARLANNIDRE